MLAANLADAWQVAYEIALRAGGDPGYPGLTGRMPRRRRRSRAGSSSSRRQAGTAPIRPRSMRWKTRSRGWSAPASRWRRAATTGGRGRGDGHRGGANSVSQQINDWEGRWPLNTYRERDAGKLSKLALERLARAEAMNIDQYRRLLARRAEIRAVYGKLAEQCDACLTLSASGTGAGRPVVHRRCILRGAVLAARRAGDFAAAVPHRWPAARAAGDGLRARRRRDVCGGSRGS